MGISKVIGMSSGCYGRKGKGRGGREERKRKEGKREGKEGEKEGEKGREEKGGKKGKKGGIAKQWGPLGRRGQRQAREASAVVGPPWKSRVSAQSSEARLVADIRFPCSKGPRVGVVK